MSRTGRTFSRRTFLAAAAGAAATAARWGRAKGVAAAGPVATRGAVVMPSDVTTWPWVERAAKAGLTTLALHGPPHELAVFAKSEPGQAFLRDCAANTIAVEYECHAANQLLPRELFQKDATLFRMNEAGERTADANLCVSSPRALEIACENAVRLAAEIPPSTGRYYFWSDDAQPMCRCPKCNGLSDSDQTLVLENAILKTLRKGHPDATLAHLCYNRTLSAPGQVKPEPGIFLEYAPIERDSTKPLGDASIAEHVKLMDYLSANLAVFGAETAQVLEYWLDVSRFSKWKRESLTQMPWSEEMYRDDLRTYAKLGIRHFTTFACWIDGEYVKRFGEPPLGEYGQGLLSLSKA